jgi:hypothetical protein
MSAVSPRPPAGTGRLVVLRHGQGEWNARDRIRCPRCGHQPLGSS